MLGHKIRHVANQLKVGISGEYATMTGICGSQVVQEFFHQQYG